MIKAVIFDCDGTLLNNSGKRPAVYPGIPELLRRLHDNEFELFVWTGRDSPSLNQFLREFQLGKYFLDIRCSGDCSPKPHPEGLRQMLQGKTPSQCVVIGDSWADMKGAENFGAHSIGALWSPEANRALLTEFGAKALVQTPPLCYDVILSF